MFIKGQKVFLSYRKVIINYLRKNPLKTREQAIRAHERFFTQVIPNIHYFTVVEDEDLLHSGIRIRMVWKEQIPQRCPWTDTVIVSKECLVPVKENNFIHLTYYV